MKLIFADAPGGELLVEVVDNVSRYASLSFRLSTEEVKVLANTLYEEALQRELENKEKTHE